MKLLSLAIRSNAWQIRIHGLRSIVLRIEKNRQAAFGGIKFRLGVPIARGYCVLIPYGDYDVHSYRLITRMKATSHLCRPSS